MMITTFLTSPYIPLILLVVVILVLISHLFLYLKLQKFLQGSNASSLEPRILELLEITKNLQTQDENITEHAHALEKRLATSVRNVSILRFKALDSNASNQSFSVALLDEKGKGFVLSSIHLRDRVSMYAKPVENYASSYDLTEEEKEVIQNVQTEQKK